MAAQKETHEQKIARLGLTYYLPDTTYYPDHILRRYNAASRDAYNAYVRNAYADSTQQAYNAKDEILSRYDRARHRLENFTKTT